MEPIKDTYRPYRFRRFHLCYPCWYGHSHGPIDYSIDHTGKTELIKRLGRKKKKQFALLYDLINLYVEYGRWDMAHSCTLGRDYRQWKGCLKYLPALKRYQPALAYLFAKTKYGHSEHDFMSEGGGINEKFELVLHWEYDDGYAGQAGSDPVNYTDRTHWTHEGLNEFLDMCYETDEEAKANSLLGAGITSFTGLLEHITKVMLPRLEPRPKKPVKAFKMRDRLTVRPKVANSSMACKVIGLPLWYKKHTKDNWVFGNTPDFSDIVSEQSAYFYSLTQAANIAMRHIQHTIEEREEAETNNIVFSQA